MKEASLITTLLTHAPIIAMGICIMLSLLFLWLAVRQKRRSRWVRSALSGGSSLFFAFISALLIGITINIHSYQRLSYEQYVAELSFKQVAGRRFVVSLTQSNGVTSIYDLSGDQWQLDAKILKWHGLANLLGFDAIYRLERLSGRYVDERDEIDEPRTVYNLAQNRVSIPDIWLWTHNYQEWLPCLDAVYGSANYLPMYHGAAYRVTVGQSGLIARETEKSR